MAICSGPVASFGRAFCKRLSGYRVACTYRRELLVLYGFSIRHLSSGYCYLGEGLGWCRDLRGGSLFRKLVHPALVEEDFGVDAQKDLEHAEAPAGGPPHTINARPVIFLAAARKITSCTFIARSIAALG
jgi:hypothetical protein